MRFTSMPRWPPAAWWRMPDEKWGETPVAYVELKPAHDRDRSTKSSSIAATCWRASRCPKAVIFTEIPKTSTGKIQKYLLREWRRRCSGIAATTDRRVSPQCIRRRRASASFG